MVDYTGLENRRAERHRGFESLSLRKEGNPIGLPSCVCEPGSNGSSYLFYYLLSALDIDASRWLYDSTAAVVHDGERILLCGWVLLWSPELLHGSELVRQIDR